MQSQSEARRFLIERYQNVEDRAAVTQFYSRFFSKYYTNWDPSKAVLLEVGAGPSLRVSIIATPFVAKIVHSDLEANCNKEAQLWVDRSPDAFNWKPTIEYVIKHCASGSKSEVDPTAVMEREEELRRKISAIIQGDVNKEKVGLDPAVIPAGGFDVVIACGCLTSAVTSQEGFVQALKNIHGVMKVGGYLCAAIAGRSTQYKLALDSKETHTLYHATDSAVKEAFTHAGLHVEDFDIQDFSSALCNITEWYGCIARK